ncbi:ABC transporter permease [Erwinia sp. JUb26]|uniref:ABC transporter permease n=1 Tax=Erwinia sp. JUb26 TaxID=2485126 RepID=UPI000F4979EF|nr:ABC transporter permease [Erwinia sp. JUb26]ROR10088.1 monosaccharide ABC transporter membrane protein (CUT2 family) [Erwinia sp. JUb26]
MSKSTSIRAADARGASLSVSLLSLLARYGFQLILLLFILFFALNSPVFLTADNLANVLQGNAILLIVALAMTLVVIAGGIDLSVGVALDFGAAFALVALKTWHWPWQGAVLAALAGGALVGLVNAILILGFRVKPFLATLGTWFIGSSLERVLTDGGGPIAYRRMAAEYHQIAVGSLWGIAIPVVIAVALMLICYLLLERTLFGKRIHAVGLNPVASLNAGVNVKRNLLWVLIASSVLCAIGGIILSANLRQFSPLAGQSYLLDAIAAVFIGTAFHPQGRPNVPGTLAGVLFLGLVANGLNLMGLDFILKDALNGLVLLVALVLSFWQGRLRQALQWQKKEAA